MAVESMFAAVGGHADWDGWLVLAGVVAVCWTIATVMAASLFGGGPRHHCARPTHSRAGSARRDTPQEGTHHG